MKTNRLWCLITVLALWQLTAGAQAQTVPPVINYQGQLLDQNGNPVNGIVTMGFAIYDAATGDTALHSETQTVAVDDGIFHALIGSVTPIAQTLFDTAPPAGFLEITVNGAVISPRHRIGSVAYAFKGGNANIHSVNAGVGLAATGTTGEVTLRIADDGVASNKILDGTIEVDDLAPRAVGSDEIAAGAVDANEIAANAVGSSEIAAGAVGSSEIADNLVIGNDIADGAVGSSALANFVDLGVGGAGGNLQVFSSAMSPVACEVATFSSGGGLIRTFNDNGDQATELSRITGSGAGRLTTRGPNGNYNVKLWDMSEAEPPVYDKGAIDVYDADGVSRAGIYMETFVLCGGGPCDLDAVVFGDTKNFRMAHPAAPDQEIWYACIEGPETAAYVRGTARLNNGKCSVVFPEHFQIVAGAEGMTALVTPLDPNSKGLAVVAKSATGIEVQELRQGAGNYDFDWEVKSVRKGHQNYRVLRSKFEIRPAGAAKKTEMK